MEVFIRDKESDVWQRSVRVMNDLALAIEYHRPVLECGRITMKVTVRPPKKAGVKIGQWAGLLSKPKTTFKTIRRYCAKRNKSR